MKAKVSLSGVGKANLSCVRKGVVVGRAACTVNILYTQIEVIDKPDAVTSWNSVQDLRESFGSLRRGLPTAAAELDAMEAAANDLHKAMSGKPASWRSDELKEGLRRVQKSFRKAVKAGFVECGVPAIKDFDLAELMADDAYLIEKAQESSK
jgi:hypothetical protein